MKNIKLNRIKLSNIIKSIFPDDKYRYLGYTCWDENSKEYPILLKFFKEVDRVARPWWCPRFILRLTHLLGNDNSIVRVRYWWVHNLHNKITGHIMITDLKWKYETFRIYGTFTDELYDLADKACEEIEKL